MTTEEREQIEKDIGNGQWGGRFWWRTEDPTVDEILNAYGQIEKGVMLQGAAPKSRIPKTTPLIEDVQEETQ